MVPSTSPDPVTVLGHLFLGGGDLPAPGAQTCGVDPTVDSLGCVGTTGCALP